MKMVHGLKVSYGFDNLTNRKDSLAFRTGVTKNIESVTKLFHSKKLFDYFDGDTYIFTRNDKRNYRQIDLLVTDKAGKTVREPVYGTDVQYPPNDGTFIESIFTHLYLKSGDKSWFHGSFTDMFLKHVFGKQKT